MTTDNLFDDSAQEFDALLVVSFGGPEGPDDVMPFLNNVFRGLRVPDSTRESIAARYYDFDGVSPINGHTRAFIAALESELAGAGLQLPVYWGNRNWHPMLADTMQQMTADGVKRAAVYVTSTFSSYSGCRKYREDLYEACQGIASPPILSKLRTSWNHPGFIEAMSAKTRDAIMRVSPEFRADSRVLFTAHSLPHSMSAASPYVSQLEDACRSIASTLELSQWSLVYQSNNARYGGEPWLGPDIAEALEAQKASGVPAVVVAPVGFVCDHMEVVLDLDVDAAAKAAEAGIEMIRAETVGTHPAYIRMVRELVEERMQRNPNRLTVGELPAKHDFCPADCCLSGRPAAPKPSLCGSTSEAFGGQGEAR